MRIRWTRIHCCLCFGSHSGNTSPSDTFIYTWAIYLYQLTQYGNVHISCNFKPTLNSPLSTLHNYFIFNGFEIQSWIFICKLLSSVLDETIFLTLTRLLLESENFVKQGKNKKVYADLLSTFTYAHGLSYFLFAFLFVWHGFKNELEQNCCIHTVYSIININVL